MNDENKILTKEEAKDLYFKCACSWFYIGRETNYYDILHNSATDKDFREWNTEYVETKLNELDYESDLWIFHLDNLLGRDLEYWLVRKIYDILKAKISNDNIFKISKLLLNPKLHFIGNNNKLFSGIIAQAKYNNDTKVVKEAFEFLIDLIENNQTEEYFYLFKACLEFNLIYELGYDSKLMGMMLDISKDKFIHNLQYREDEFITLCYLTGYIQEKNYINAYKGLKLHFDLWNETSEIFIEKLKLINKITQMKYTVDDVLALDSFPIDDPKEDELTAFIKKEFKES